MTTLERLLLIRAEGDLRLRPGTSRASDAEGGMSCFDCGGPATYVMHPLELVACPDCLRAWIREESFSLEAIEAAVGAFHLSGRSYAEHCARFDAELLSRTRAWVAARKTARAA